MIRPAKIEDATEIARIHVETWRSAYAGIMPADFLAKLSIENRKKMWATALERNPFDFFIADDGSTMAGWCHSTIFRGEGAKVIGETRAVYVLPESQRRGHGAALMSATESDFRARGVCEAILWVLEANHATRRFYERLGYIPDGGQLDDTYGSAKLRVVRYKKIL